MENLDFKFMAISDYFDSLSDYFESFDYYQDDDSFMLEQLDRDVLLN